MKSIIRALILTAIPTTVLAATGNVPEDTNLLMWGFLGFGSLVLLIQAVPAGVMFASMLKGLFSTSTVSERN